MAWIKVELCTPDKPEIVAMAHALGCSRGNAFAGCFVVWGWFNEQSRDGNARGVTGTYLDALQAVTTGVVGLVHAMKKVGWFCEDESGCRIPNWDRHGSETAKTRALTAIRVAKHRGRNVTQEKRSKRNKNVTREEKRREEVNSERGSSLDISSSKKEAIRFSLLAEFWPDGLPSAMNGELDRLVDEYVRMKDSELPDEIQKRAANLRRHWLGGDGQVTAGSLLNHWSKAGR